MTFLWIALGAFIGWNLPQPEWAQSVQEKITAWWQEKFGN